jgi:hypothetical protein
MSKLEEALRATHLLLEALERDRASGAKELRSRFDRLGKAMLIQSRLVAGGGSDASGRSETEESLTLAATTLREDTRETSRRHRTMRRVVTLMMD